MTADAKVVLLLVALVAVNLAIFASRELHGALAPILRGLGV